MEIKETYHLSDWNSEIRQNLISFWESRAFTFSISEKDWVILKGERGSLLGSFFGNAVYSHLAKITITLYDDNKLEIVIDVVERWFLNIDLAGGQDIKNELGNCEKRVLSRFMHDVDKTDSVRKEGVKLLTRKEFDNLPFVYKSGWFQIIILLVLMFGGLVIGSRYTTILNISNIWGVIFAVLIPLFYMVVTYFHLKFIGQTCPYCNQQFHYSKVRLYASNTGKCISCGNLVLEKKNA